MIHSAQEFRILCRSKSATDVVRSLQDHAHVDVWAEVLSVSPQMAIHVVLNRTLTESALRMLAKTPDETARSLLAARARLPRDVFALLASDRSELVRRRIAANAKAPLEIVRKLARDPVGDVARIAASNVARREPPHALGRGMA